MPLIDAVGWVCVCDRRLLCVRSRGKDAFYLPGGKREPGESDWEALSREVCEEVKVSLQRDDFEFFGIYHGPAHGYSTGRKVEIICYTASYEGTPTPSREIERMGWFVHRDRHCCAVLTKQILDELYLKDRID
ncbi:MAG: NUDIX domain-containing protein [Elainellaceae cyanobacterium]